MNFRFGISIVLLGLGSPLSADEPDLAWSRYRDTAPGPRLEMAVRRLARDGVQFDLIAVMHMGDAVAYRALSKRCEMYDVLLYEHGERPAQPKLPSLPTDGKVEEAYETTPDYTERFYDLTDQFKVMDFVKPNYVWADLPREELIRELTSRGENLLEALGETDSAGSAIDDFLGQTDATQSWNLLALPNGQILFKRAVAQFLTRTQLSPVPEHPVIILKRNDRALQVLREQISARKKRIGLLYGAGHMPDFWRKLVRHDRWIPESEEWYTLWDLRSPPSAK